MKRVRPADLRAECVGCMLAVLHPSTAEFLLERSTHDLRHDNLDLRARFIELAWNFGWIGRNVRAPHFETIQRLDSRLYLDHGSHQRHRLLVSLPSLLAVTCSRYSLVVGFDDYDLRVVWQATLRVLALGLRCERHDCALLERFCPDCATLCQSAGLESPCSHAERSPI